MHGLACQSVILSVCVYDKSDVIMCLFCFTCVIVYMISFIGNRYLVVLVVVVKISEGFLEGP
jgi:hypothetical protein